MSSPYTHEHANLSFKQCTLVHLYPQSALIYAHTQSKLTPSLIQVRPLRETHPRSAGHDLRWTHHPWQTEETREESGMKKIRKGGREGVRRLAFSSALEEFILTAKLFLLYVPLLLIKPTHFPYPGSLFLPPNLHPCNQHNPVSLPLFLFSLLLIKFHPCTLLSIYVRLPWCRNNDCIVQCLFHRIRLTSHTPLWSTSSLTGLRWTSAGSHLKPF